MSASIAHRGEEFANHVKTLRTAKRLSQSDLAARAGITRQAVSAIESNVYLPTIGVVLHLAAVLDCPVEALFSLSVPQDLIEGTWMGGPVSSHGRTAALRVKVSVVGKKTIVRPVTGLGEVLAYSVPADGYLVNEGSVRPRETVRVRLSRDRRAIEQEIAVAGCDPAIFLAGEHLRRQKDESTVVGWTMGSMAALRALQQGEVHVAGLHLYDPSTGESNLPFLRRVLKGAGYDVVTFATWEEGLLVRPGNPQSIRSVADLADASVRIINREEGAGARLLLDQHLRASGIDPSRVQGYDRTAASHFEVARAVTMRQADAGVGIRSAAQLFDLDFVPLQAARYDLVVPKAYLKSHPTLAHLFDTLTSRAFRTEIEALGGYDTRETGTIRSLRG